MFQNDQMLATFFLSRAELDENTLIWCELQLISIADACAQSDLSKIKVKVGPSQYDGLK